MDYSVHEQCFLPVMHFTRKLKSFQVSKLKFMIHKLNFQFCKLKKFKIRQLKFQLSKFKFQDT